MYIYEVGKPFPHANATRVVEGGKVITNAAFLDVVLYTTEPKADATLFAGSELKHYAYVHDDTLPFLCFLFPAEKFSFDASVNALAIAGDDVRRRWLAGTANVVNLFLVDSRTNVLHAAKLLGVPWAERVRAACARQVEEFSSARDVERAIMTVMDRLGTAEMIRLSRGQS